MCKVENKENKDDKENENKDEHKDETENEEEDEEDEFGDLFGFYEQEEPEQITVLPEMNKYPFVLLPKHVMTKAEGKRPKRDFNGNVIRR